MPQQRAHYRSVKVVETNGGIAHEAIDAQWISYQQVLHEMVAIVVSLVVIAVCINILGMISVD